MYTTLRARGAAGSRRWMLLKKRAQHHASSLSFSSSSLSRFSLDAPSRPLSLSDHDWQHAHTESRLNHHLSLRYFTTDGGNDDDESSHERKHKKHKESKPNFDRDILQRAARGELAGKKHTSGIPRLAARKHKANLRPPSAGARAGRLALGRAADRRFDFDKEAGEGGDDGEENWPEEDQVVEDDTHQVDDISSATMDSSSPDDDVGDDDSGRLSSALQRATAQQQQFSLSGSVGGGGGGRDGGGSGRGGVGVDRGQDTRRGVSSPLEEQSFDELVGGDEYHAFELMNDSKYYWREEEQESLLNESEDFDESFLYDEKGDFVVEYTEEDLEPRPLMEIETPESRQREERLLAGGDYDDDGGGGRDDWEPKQVGPDPEERFFYDNNDIFEICQRRDGDDFYDPMTPEQEADYNTVMPLAPHEPGLDGFLQAMNEHPTKYATVTYEHLHPGSKREPKPLFFPKTRKQAPVEWVESHKRFLYVTGLPPLTVNGEPGDMSNAIHRSLLQQTVAKLVVGVEDSSQVCPANRRSAFVGFPSPRALARALAAGPTEAYQVKVPMISQYQPAAAAVDKEEQVAEFVAQSSTKSPDCIVHLTNIPPGNTSASIARNLFPQDTKVGEVYGGLKAEDVYFLTKTSVLVRFASAEQAQSAVSSSLVLKRLEEWGTYPVQFMRARRELVHAGFDSLTKDEEIRVMGPRLIVDGDMPSKDFHISHAGTILLRNIDATLDPATLKKDLTALFQPFCERRRDGNRSVEFVTCEAGRFMGHAYIGFDEPGEAEACIDQCKGRLKFGDRMMGMKLVHDRLVPHQPAFKPEKRPARSEEELLDDLNNWEKYVDPADIEYLQKHGVSKLVIDEALRGIRRSNPTFGAFDAGMRSESLEPSKERGQQYKELVEMYIDTLKECVPTPDDVGEMYEALHYPDEPIDLTIFDEWNEKLKEIERVRS